MKPKVLKPESTYDYVLSLVRAGRSVPDPLFHLEKRAREQLQREESRRKFPETAALLDEVRKLFPEAAVLKTDEPPATSEDPTTA